MNYNPPISVKKQIRNLLFVLLGGAIFAFLGIFFFIHQYGPLGNYSLKNALLSPEVISTLSTAKSGKNTLTFDKIVYSYQDYETKQKTIVPVDKEKYSKLYKLISDDNSLQEIPPDIASSFNQMPLASLHIVLQDDKYHSEKKITQEVQFLYKGDYYRLQLRESKEQGLWIYFYHPNIYNDTFHLFTDNK